MKLLWVYFQVPYADNATAMRALLAFQNGSTIMVVPTPAVRDVPAAVVEADKIAAERNSGFSNETVFIYAHDERHGLAWPVKEQADAKGCQFSRQVPQSQYPDPSDTMLFCAYENGRPELSPADAQQEILDLNSEAKEEFAYGDMLPVMTKLRFALDTALKSFGWTHPLTVFTLRNLMYAFQGTGNSDNLKEAEYLGKKFAYEFKSKTPSIEEWKGSEMFFGHLAETLSANGFSETANEIRSLESLLSSDRR